MKQAIGQATKKYRKMPSTLYIVSFFGQDANIIIGTCRTEKGNVIFIKQKIPFLLRYLINCCTRRNLPFIDSLFFYETNCNSCRLTFLCYFVGLCWRIGNDNKHLLKNTFCFVIKLNVGFFFWIIIFTSNSDNHCMQLFTTKVKIFNRRSQA